MSNRRKPRGIHNGKGTRMKVAPPMPGEGEGYASVPALVPDRLEPNAEEHARSVTHDQLIHVWGSARRSGIWWTQHVGAEALRRYKELCEASGQEPGEEPLSILQDNPRGLLVVAWAIVLEGVTEGEPAVGWIEQDDES